MINSLRSFHELFCKVAHLTVPSLSILYKEAAKWAEEGPCKLWRLFLLSTLSLDSGTIAPSGYLQQYHILNGTYGVCTWHLFSMSALRSRMFTQVQSYDIIYWKADKFSHSSTTGAHQSGTSLFRHYTICHHRTRRLSQRPPSWPAQKADSAMYKRHHITGRKQRFIIPVTAPMSYRKKRNHLAKTDLPM